MRIRLVEATTNSLEVKATSLSSEVTILNWYLDSDFVGSIWDGDPSWPTYTFYGLEPGMTYEVKAASFNEGGERLEVIKNNFTTLDDREKVDRFYWGINMESGKPINITAQEWKRFIRTVVDYINIVEGTNIDPSDTDAYSASPGQIMRASQANSALGLLQRCDGRTSDWVNSGETITPQFFMGLQERFNNVVDAWNNGG